MFSTNGKPTHIQTIVPNFYNNQFSVGENVLFKFKNQTKMISGVILKLYTNSCLVDISKTKKLQQKEIGMMNGRTVVNYKNIAGCLLK